MSLSGRQIPSYRCFWPTPKKSLHFCLVTYLALFLWSFPRCLVTTSCSMLGEEAGDSELPARGCIRGRQNSRLGDQIRTATFPQNPQMCRQMPYVQKSVFLLVQESAIFQNKPFCTFGQNVGTLECLVRSSYPQLHGIINLIQILQGGLEIVLLSCQTFTLTDLHSAEYLCSVYMVQYNKNKKILKTTQFLKKNIFFGHFRSIPGFYLWLRSQLFFCKVDFFLLQKYF